MNPALRAFLITSALFLGGWGLGYAFCWIAEHRPEWFASGFIGSVFGFMFWWVFEMAYQKPNK